ncbi:short-chain dehydrogenase [Planococcus maritimus]|nr:short-chain dehydrogenase [Planococcus sp. SK3692]MDE4083565.1 short-chain dehydrogenase [Planococcus maritimus]
MKHALVIGGTGMLAQATLELSRNGYRVSVIGRSEQKMQQLLDQNRNQLMPVFVDYSNTKAFAAELIKIQQQGTIQLIIAWIHASGSDVIPCLSELLPASIPCKLVHVIGSSSKRSDIQANHNIPLPYKLSPSAARVQNRKGRIPLVDT